MLKKWVSGFGNVLMITSSNYAAGSLFAQCKSKGYTYGLYSLRVQRSSVPATNVLSKMISTSIASEPVAMCVY
ncbi:hypothetical protein I3843_07G048900 [Carya illinoinensis]|nr:hypothetical protein I3843_07G048900 [Carya illinoinensis]KAG7969787.1 hypothetical protein I3843_07G048900 [Carya illinoinensis]